jgi:lipopolysaccharide export system protein LptA
VEHAGSSITSDKLEISFNDDQTEFTFTGNVKLNSSEFSAECVAAKVTTFGRSLDPSFGTESIKRILVTGPLNLQYGDRCCSAEHAEITPFDSTILLSGEAVISGEMGTVSGNEICINYKTKSVEISSNVCKPVTVDLGDGTAANASPKNITPPTSPLSQENKFFEENITVHAIPFFPEKIGEINNQNKNLFPKIDSFRRSPVVFENEGEP